MSVVFEKINVKHTKSESKPLDTIFFPEINEDKLSEATKHKGIIVTLEEHLLNSPSSFPLSQRLYHIINKQKSKIYY